MQYKPIKTNKKNNEEYIKNSENTKKNQKKKNEKNIYR